MEMKSKYEDFYTLIQADDRSATLDPGNVKMTFNNVSSLLWVSLIPVTLFECGMPKMRYWMELIQEFKLHTRCVRNMLIASLSTSFNNVVILSSCNKAVTHKLLNGPFAL